MTTRQLFEFVTVPLESDEAESECLDKIMKLVESTSARLNSTSEDDRRKATQQEAVDEAVFMSQFLPRSLNQVAEHEIRKLAEGDVEDTYAHAVAALTGNVDVVKAVARKTGRDQGASVRPVLLTAVETIGDAAEIKTKSDQAKVKFQDVADESVDGQSDDVSCDASDAVSDDESEEEGPKFIKVPRTPEQLEAEKNAIREIRRANKKAVKESTLEKRKTKIKKKDKKRAINKAKTGNKKK